IRRPRNPFIIFRTEYYRTKKSSLTFEKDHRHISRIIGFCWRNLSPAEKKPWYDKAAAEKKEHARLYPDYQYIPLTRNEPVRRRK
ncbi:high mobility group box domain-containing protein, partial [Irpex lacteus]